MPSHPTLHHLPNAFVASNIIKNVPFEKGWCLSVEEKDTLETDKKTD
jgi:hypothetical protein